MVQKLEHTLGADDALCAAGSGARIVGVLISQPLIRVPANLWYKVWEHTLGADVLCGTGSGAGIAGVLIGQPLDVVRIRLQQLPQAAGAAAYMRAMVAQEGMRSLFRGTLFPLTTITLQVRTFLKNCPPDDWSMGIGAFLPPFLLMQRSPCR